MNSLPPKLIISVVLALAVIPTLGVGAPMREYMAPMHESKWEVSQEGGECLLQHNIPGLGNAKLRQNRQEPLSFELHITQGITLGNQCQVQIAPPSWRHGIKTNSLGTIKLVSGAEHIQAKGGAAKKIYQGLGAGMMTSFNCINGKSKVRVVISPVRYLIALPDFQKCIGSLVSNNSASVKPTKTKKK